MMWYFKWSPVYISILQNTGVLRIVYIYLVVFAFRTEGTFFKRHTPLRKWPFHLGHDCIVNTWICALQIIYVKLRITIFLSITEFDYWRTAQAHHFIMMTSSNGNIFRVTDPLCGEFNGQRWIPRTKASDAELWCFLWSVPWVNSREAGDLRRHGAHHDVIVMMSSNIFP